MVVLIYKQDILLLITLNDNYMWGFLKIIWYDKFKENEINTSNKLSYKTIVYYHNTIYSAIYLNLNILSYIEMLNLKISLDLLFSYIQSSVRNIYERAYWMLA